MYGAPAWVGGYEFTGGGGGASGMVAGVPQLGQKRMFSGTEVPQFEQERVDTCDMDFFPSLFDNDGGQ